jgi:4a-hydroxytetrahydrobiopterin dehydratase
MGFTNSLGAICEQQNHHADFELGWGRVRAVIYTHKIDGLSESDFVLAAKFDRV